MLERLRLATAGNALLRLWTGAVGRRYDLKRADRRWGASLPRSPDLARNADEPAKAPARGSIDVSRSIEVARVLCIFFMMYAHATGVAAAEAFDGAKAWHSPALGLARFLQNDASAAAVPLLSSISGWLFAASFRKGLVATIERKAETLIAPLISWNLLLIGVFLVAGLVIPLQWSPPDTALGWANDILGVTEWPVNFPLYFLRDLFLATIAGGILLAWRLPPWAFLACATALLAAALTAPAAGLFHQPLIPFQFVIGMMMQRTINVGLARTTWLIGGAGVLVAIVKTLVHAGNHIADEAMFRLSGAAIFWVAAVLIARTAASGAIIRLGPSIFFVFCAHYIIFTVINGVAKPLTSGELDPAWLLVFALQPLAALLLGTSGHRLLARYAPHAIIEPLTGGRGRKRRSRTLAAGH